MDLKHSNVPEVTVVADAYMPGSKSSDLIKPPVTNGSSATLDKPALPAGEFRMYKRRWLVLALFVMYSASNALQWIQYSIIANIVQRYYNITSTWVDWTSMIFMILYIPLIFPASWILDKMGLRIAAIAGVLGTCLGAWVKCFSVSPELFWVGFIGQSIVAASQVFILSLPAKVAAVWFGPDQVSSACSIGVFGNQLGIAVGFLVPPMLVENHDDISLIGDDLRLMFYIVAGFTTLLVVLVLFFFKAAPPTPPSAAQEATKTPNPLQSSPFLHSIKRLMLNRNYVLLLISYGMNVGVFYAISTLLNQIVLTHYPGHEVDAGRIGVCIVFAGMLGSVACGIVLDKTHRFKETTLAVYVFTMIGMWIYTFTLSVGHISVVYVTSSLLGFFMTGYLPVGFEFAAELTYPEPEGTSTGLLNAAAQVFGITFTMLYSELLNTNGDIVANVTMAVMLLVGSVVTAVIRSDLRRQAAQNPQHNP
ncbi:feline leukemia virus subgroup C receptor-related protein 2-like [Anopheles albimanus]|uniref:feline leukemia virus subgroup C receptor-related protein 2-like n=1 Tax=Anopheles albimanus TaxID=7167 RepID=UPI0016401067|nr:feline leukemia virus subgroup C receptor-related protein 2-like [Anopheles albimanus]XP_035785900.1 feline leukemia virus subgroup C receptor-related protein 2-like [Anopheles albimanus]XP_035785901.1 feline leukemia virus subgroup C receptor-related protein 2-like [Anopheles albimanus]XP_035785902.1 feline leukemia virus subgroup C receptor-related protein 2-like [Anopheles albimanus]XP_035785903.1 feline leukemia virus subgroup C receptor-related protein 2-like [Anopheles albimanus]XP_03